MVGIREHLIGRLVCLAVTLLLLGQATTASSEGDSFYPLRLELMTTSGKTKLECLSGQLVVGCWEFDEFTAIKPQVTTCPFISVSKPCCYPDTITFDVCVTIPEGTPLRWRVAVVGREWAHLAVYTNEASDGEGRSLLAEFTYHGDASLADNSKVFWLPGDKVTGLVQPITLQLDSTEPTFLPCEQMLDVPYAIVPDTDPLYTSLDLYLPSRDTRDPPPLVVWLHGGGWTIGDKGQRPPAQTNLHGALGDSYAVARVNYRLSQIAQFPAQIYDCKAAIRWLRGHAEEYGYDPDHIGVWGLSAGGHLAALLGVTAGMTALEGTLGEYLDESSAVQAVCDYVGPVDLTLLAEQAPKENVEELEGYVSHLLGGPLADTYELAVLASPVSHVSSDDAPFLIVQGDNDGLCSVHQSIALDQALTQAGVPTQLLIIPGASHVFPYDADIVAAVRRFFDQYLTFDAP